jgi:uncharacterized protein (TIGR01370 family)
MAFIYATIGVVWLIVPSKNQIAEKLVIQAVEQKTEQVKLQAKQKVEIAIRNAIVPTVPVSKPITSWLYYIKDVDVDKVVEAKVDMVVIDLETKTGPITKVEVQRIKDSGKVVIAYLSLGEAEDYRPYWDQQWKPGHPEWLGKQSTVWKGNYVVKDLMSKEWTEVSKKQLTTVKQLGFDGIVVAGVNGSNGQADLYLTRVAEFAKKDNDDFKVFVQDYLSDQLFDKIDGVVKQGLTYNLFGVANKNVAAQVARLKQWTERNKKVFVVEFVDPTKWQIANKTIADNQWLGYNGPVELNAINVK